MPIRPRIAPTPAVAAVTRQSFEPTRVGRTTSVTTNATVHKLVPTVAIRTPSMAGGGGVVRVTHRL